MPNKAIACQSQSTETAQCAQAVMMVDVPNWVQGGTHQNASKPESILGLLSSPPLAILMLRCISWALQGTEDGRTQVQVSGGCVACVCAACVPRSIRILARSLPRRDGNRWTLARVTSPSGVFGASRRKVYPDASASNLYVDGARCSNFRKAKIQNF